MPSDAWTFAHALTCLLVLYIPTVHHQSTMHGPALNITDPDVIVVGTEVTVTCRLKPPPGQKDSFTLEWNLDSMSSARIQSLESTNDEIISTIALRVNSLEDAYDKVAVCKGRQTNGRTITVEWTPSNVIAPPGKPVVTGPVVVIVEQGLNASCTSYGAFGAEPVIQWLDANESDVTLQHIAETISSGGIPLWQVTALLWTSTLKPFKVEQFVCMVTQVQSNTTFRVPYSVYVLGTGRYTEPIEHDHEGMRMIFSDVSQLTELGIITGLLLDYKLPDLNMSDMESAFSFQLNKQWRFRVGIIEIFNVGVYESVGMYAAAVGTVLVAMMTVFGILSYLRRVNEKCYCC